MKKIFRNWVYVDTRTLALFRILFGFLGLCVGSVEDDIFRSRNLYNFASKQTVRFIDTIRSENFKVD